MTQLQRAENPGWVSLERDNVFGDNTPAQVRAKTLAKSGAAGGGFRGSAVVVAGVSVSERDWR